MPQIKRISDGALFTVASTPIWSNGTWECGDQRFTDPTQSQYQAAATLPLLTPMTLYMAFTPAERVAIKASSDPMVKEFWAMYQLSAQLNKPTDPNLVSVQEALAYLATPTSAVPPGPGILATAARVQQISAGIPQ